VPTPHLDGRVVVPAFRYSVVALWVKFKQSHKNLPALKGLLVETLVVKHLSNVVEAFG
jgi:hypothetical protein